VVAPTAFVATFRGSRGQQSRINQPISTVTSVNHHAVVAPQILSYYGRDHVCADADQPLSTVTPNPRHALAVPQAEPHLLTYHGHSGWHPIGLPTTTQTTKERHALVLPNGTELDLVDTPTPKECGILGSQRRLALTGLLQSA
jgi:DNA (cytosine-5)-methyltransferase 1